MSSGNLNYFVCFSLKKCSSDADAVSCLILGSEDGSITFVESEAFTVLQKVIFRNNQDTALAPHAATQGDRVQIRLGLVIVTWLKFNSYGLHSCVRMPFVSVNSGGV